MDLVAAVPQVGQGSSSIDHCPVSSVRIAIEKNSSSISSSQDDLTAFLMPTDLITSPAAKTNGTTDGSIINRTESRNGSSLSQRIQRFHSARSSCERQDSDRGADRMKADEDKEDVRSSSLFKQENVSADVNQSAGERDEDVRRSQRTTDGREDGVRDDGRNQITASDGYTAMIQIKDGRESSHHKRIIDHEFNSHHKVGAGSEADDTNEEDAAVEAAKLTHSSIKTTEGRGEEPTTTIAAAITESKESCISLDGSDHVDEGTDDRKRMIKMTDQSEISRLSLPGNRKSSPGTTTATSLSSAGLLLLHPPDPAVFGKNQSNLENNLLHHHHRSHSNKRRTTSGGDLEAGDASHSYASGPTASIATGTTAATESSSRFKLKVEYESSCGSSGPTIDPVSMAGSASVAQVWEEKQRISLSRERKAARVLGIVMGLCISSSACLRRSGDCLFVPAVRVQTFRVRMFTLSLPSFVERKLQATGHFTSNMI